MPWTSPVLRHIVEVEAYNRIFRVVEWLHSALMDILYNPLTQEFSVSCDFTFDKKKKSLFEDKIVFVLGCMLLL